jgi:hypothetical protein
MKTRRDQPLHAQPAHVAERHRRAGGVLGFQPSITLVAARPTPILGGSLAT